MRKMNGNIGELIAKKVQYTASKAVLVSILGGMFISLAAMGSLSISADPSGGSTALVLSGIVFSIGLVMTMMFGADIFTGNTLIVLPLMQRKTTAQRFLANLLLVLLGNFLGALLVVSLGTTSGFFTGRVLDRLLFVADHKISLAWYAQISAGILCNLLVSIAVLMAYLSENTVGKIISCILPVTLFIICGYEHIVANMFILPAAYILREAAGGEPFPLPAMLQSFLMVGLGNLVGGLFVGCTYYYSNMYSKNHVHTYINTNESKRHIV